VIDALSKRVLIPTAERRTPHRKPIFAKPLINNYLRELGELGLDKRCRVHPLPVGNFPLGRRVGYSYKWNYLFNARIVSVRFLTFGVVTPDYARRRTAAPGRKGSRGVVSLNRGALLATGKLALKSNAVCS
jgi:hypothetical protein